MSKESRDFFWPRYVDLMTVLFLVIAIVATVEAERHRAKRQ